MFVMYGHVLHRLREHLNVPGSSSVDKEPLTRELRRLLSRLNETSGGFMKIVAAEKSVLSKGLNFVPLQKKSDEFSAKFDTEQFFRRVQLKAFFHDKQNSGNTEKDEFSPNANLSGRHSNHFAVVRT